MATHPSQFCDVCLSDPCACLTLNQRRRAAGLPDLQLLDVPLYSPRIPEAGSLFHFRRIRRRHLRLLPPAAATVAAALTLGVLTGLFAVLITVGAYVGTAAAIAGAETYIEWRQERRRDRAIEQTIGVYPIASPRHPKHIGGTPA